MRKRWHAIAERAVTLPALLALVVLALLAGGLVAFVAIQSGGDEVYHLAGNWTIGLITQRGPEAARVGQTLSCRSILRQNGTALTGEMECDSQGTNATVEGFALTGRDDLRLSAEFDDVVIDILARVVSPVQLVGSWEDSQGFAGRFVAIREKAASD